MGADERSGDEGIELAARLPEYVVVFLTGIALSAALGLTFAGFAGRVDAVPAVLGIAGTPSWLASVTFGALASPGAVTIVAYTFLAGALVLLLTGGATGGGFANMGVGAIGTLFGGHTRPGDDYDDPAVRRGLPGSTDPRERLRKGLRPEANPRAFWQVVAGLCYVAIALAMLSNLT